MRITTCLGTCPALLVHLQVPTVTAVWSPYGARGSLWVRLVKMYRVSVALSGVMY